MSKTLTLKEAARFLKISPEALRRKANAGVIPGAKLGRC
jgi:excisionase family DNA binding protein